MKGGFLVGLDQDLFARAADVLSVLGGTVAADLDNGRVAQLVDESGRRFTLYETVPVGTEWEYRDGPFQPAAGVQVPDMGQVVACPFECRWEDMASRTVHAIASAVETPVWVLDGEGVIWDAHAVDPRAVRL
jgi:hypothetical protein